MKDFIIRINDYLCYFVIIAFVVIGYGTYHILGAFGGFVVGSVLAGFWLVLSGIYDEVRKLAAGKQPLR